jgi:ParB family transcriptional regulator, chromosome partitioning protein
MRKRSLGRGLSDLLSGEALTQSRAVIEIGVDEIEPNPRQPRQSINENGLEELTLSVETYGVLQPIIVRRSGSGYQIVAGERRWRAARRAGLRTIPSLVQEADDSQSLQVAMVENLQRDDLNALEAARGYRALVDDFGLTQEEVAQRVGKSRPAVANTLRLLELPETVQAMLRAGQISEGHGRALLPLVGREADLEGVLERIAADASSVREAERMVREILAPSDSADAAPPPAPRPPGTDHDLVRDPHIAAAEVRLQTALAAKVAIRPSAKRGGVIHIRYYDTGDLQRLLDALGGAGESGE